MKVTVYQGSNFVLTNQHVLHQAAKLPTLAPVLVIVPDRFTLQAERVMLGQCGQLLNARIVTFSMLYQQVANEIARGQPTPQTLDKTSAVLHLWTAIKQVQDQLVWFKKSVAHYDFAEKMFNTLNQMRSSCVDFAAIETAVQSAVARQKYHDINLIYQAYTRVVGEQFDSSAMLSYLAEQIPHCESLKTTAVFVCGFESLSPARLRVVQALCRHAAQVTIAASEPELSRQLSAYPHYQIKTTDFAPQTHTARCLDERGEAQIVARKVIELLNLGTAPEKIVVLLAEFDTAAPVWQVVFAEHKIPVNLDVGKKLSTTAEAKYLRDLLELSLNDCAENTLAVLFNQHSAIDSATAADLENQILQRNLRARYVKEIKQLAATKDTRELCQQLKQFTQQEKLLDILDKIATCHGEHNLARREFINLFWTLCSATKISEIPTYVNRVLVAPVNDWVPVPVDNLFIANCSAENFPQGQADDDILQEVDLQGTNITPTPSLQRARNYRHAELLKTVAEKGLYLSGTHEDFLPVEYTPRTTFQLKNDDTQLANARALFFPKQHVSTTMLECYYQCPQLNFWQNGLRLRPRELYQLKKNNIGSAIHTALQHYFEHHDLEAAVKYGLEKLDYDYPPLVNNLAKEMRFIIKQLETAFRGGKFRVAAVEKPIQKKLPADLTLVGRVDRVDVAPLADGKQAFAVLDYKTGHVAGSLAKNIYLGCKLQLPVYAAALHEKSMGQIAGAGYLALGGEYAVDEKKIEIKGFIAEDYQDLFAPAVLNPKAHQYVPPMTIARLCQHANDLVQAAVEKILAGDVRARAVEPNTCKYCPLQPFCQQAGENCRADELGEKITFKTFAEEQNA